MRSGTVFLPRIAAMHRRRCSRFSVSTTVVVLLPRRGLVEFLRKETVYLFLHVTRQLPNNGKRAHCLTRCGLYDIGLVFVVINADSPEVMLPVRTTLAYR